jgi:hypothetical protein
MGPRDEVKYGVPINIETGHPLTDVQLERVQKLTAAIDELLAVMHECEGSNPGNPEFSSRRMKIAFTQLELAMLMAKRAALETP